MNEQTHISYVEELRAKKSSLLLKAESLAARKNQLFGDIDISQPMSKEEKELNKQIADIFSQINQIVMDIRRANKTQILYGGTGIQYSKLTK